MKHHFAYSQINSRVNSNNEIATKKPTRKIFLDHLDLNSDPIEPKASVLPMRYADTFDNFSLDHCIIDKKFKLKSFSKFGV